MTLEKRELRRTRVVWWANRRTGLKPGVTLAELANDYAEGIRRPRMFAGGAPGMCAIIEAEDAFDVTERITVDPFRRVTGFRSARAHAGRSSAS